MRAVALVLLCAAAAAAFDLDVAEFAQKWHVACPDAGIDAALVLAEAPNLVATLAGRWNETHIVRVGIKSQTAVHVEITPATAAAPADDEDEDEKPAPGFTTISADVAFTRTGAEEFTAVAPVSLAEGAAPTVSVTAVVKAKNDVTLLVSDRAAGTTATVRLTGDSAEAARPMWMQFGPSVLLFISMFGIRMYQDYIQTKQTKKQIAATIAAKKGGKK